MHVLQSVLEHFEPYILLVVHGQVPVQHFKGDVSVEGHTLHEGQQDQLLHPIGDNLRLLGGELELNICDGLLHLVHVVLTPVEHERLSKLIYYFFIVQQLALM